MQMSGNYRTRSFKDTLITVAELVGRECQSLSSRCWFSGQTRTEQQLLSGRISPDDSGTLLAFRIDGKGRNTVRLPVALYPSAALNRSEESVFAGNQTASVGDCKLTQPPLRFGAAMGAFGAILRSLQCLGLYIQLSGSLGKAGGDDAENHISNNGKLYGPVRAVPNRSCSRPLDASVYCFVYAEETAAVAHTNQHQARGHTHASFLQPSLRTMAPGIARRSFSRRWDLRRETCLVFEDAGSCRVSS
ncbi:hypothetical protein DNTS_005298 [Danionella cerebrum]|uniref:Uncharacterized protein n=1 Tax=Danionella cerebrum TaxID=2873325 RepID=A0A553R8W2_9TELE|nr:hypothetical protein DNTS_005298 [Danionella translucida]